MFILVFSVDIFDQQTENWKQYFFNDDGMEAKGACKVFFVHIVEYFFSYCNPFLKS